ncbi:MAG: SRPBCC family protein [Euzebyales bacterium]|nr:SRPBCC family protein [Euzebyales bacterium]
MTSVIENSIEVDRPASTVYDQWTQFEEFPQFMEGVERVEQLDDRRLRHAEIGGADREWDAEIAEQVPDEVIALRATGDTGHTGRVTFDRLSDASTRVNLRTEYQPKGLTEKAGDMLGVVDRRVKGDLDRFKAFIESRGTETGAWRGEIR